MFLSLSNVNIPFYSTVAHDLAKNCKYLRMIHMMRGAMFVY